MWSQVCVSIDYVVVPRSIAVKFYEGLRKAYESFFPTDPLHPDSKWGKIINRRHFDRLTGLIKHTNGKIFLGGRDDPASHRIELTVVKDVKLDDVLMEEWVSVVNFSATAADCLLL